MVPILLFIKHGHDDQLKIWTDWGRRAMIQTCEQVDPRKL